MQNFDGQEENLSGIRSQRDGRETEGSGELNYVFIAKLYSATAAYIQGWEMLFQTVTYLVPFILHLDILLIL